MFEEETGILREKMLQINGLGPETVDSILLYAGEKPVFVVDAYTKRILLRHGLVPETAGYAELQNIFMENLDHDVRLFNEYHALLVHVGKYFCKPRENCGPCPLNGLHKRPPAAGQRTTARRGRKKQ
jgi:endonuclease-3 related protein